MEKVRVQASDPLAPARSPQPNPAEAPADPTHIHLIEYDANSFDEREITSVEDVFDCLDNNRISWIDVAGLGDKATLYKLAEHFRIHPLAIEDAVNTGQRPHVDEYVDQLCVVLQMAYYNADQEIVFEQVSLFLGKGYVITIQETPERDVFEPLRRRLREGLGSVRYMRSDFLAYALIDAVVDQFFPISESLAEAIEEMEDELLENPTRDRMRQVHQFRQALTRLRRAVWPNRDVLTRLWRDESGLIADRTKPFLRDTLDHVLAIVDLLETHHETASNFVDLYISSLSMRTNEIMRVLTVISSIFIPLTFIAGLYGMNFDPQASPWNMPELKLFYGYPMALILMLLVALGMLWFFRRKKWL
ncbi:MAG: magnesium/cobalt transporter CorA [Verrucomicrobia bacterium]|nr:magnesium/cobalt transporter CorA [Verrucomicrobiota bacterium]